MKALAIKYRPRDWDEVTEQSATLVILQNQLENNDIRNAYLFCGPAGCGKTTCARIFANNINNWEGAPIEMDAASNNSVDDVREIDKMAQSRAVDGEYKIFIIDECHMITNQGWNAMLKLIEEPPAKSIFIFCTTDPQKIPKTILSRVQRYDFKRISISGIVDRLQYVFLHEQSESEDYYYDKPALDYIARLADGHMRDALTMLDKCLAFSNEVTVENVSKALGRINLSEFIMLTDALYNREHGTILAVVNNAYRNGVDLKQYVKDYTNFILDMVKYNISDDISMTSLPDTDDIRSFLNNYKYESETLHNILTMLIEIDGEIKWSQSPRYVIEARLLTY